MTLALLGNLPDERAFVALFSRLCVALREQQDDSGITQQVYWEALSDVPLRALEAGATALMREPGRKWFPTTAEWRTAAEIAQGRQLRQAVQPVRDEPWHDECAGCRDTGWRQDLTCPGDTTCGRRTAHAPHDYTQPCPCRPSNRTYLRHQHFGRGAA